jgi:hemin uptake protein HemP
MDKVQSSSGEAPEKRPPPLRSELLLRGHRVIEIVHNGEIYRLQATRQGKLILTK